LLTIAANTFSGIAAITRLEPIMRVLRPALKTAGAAGVLLGLIGVSHVRAAAVIGLILFFVCAAYTHIRVSDYSSTFSLGSCFFLRSRWPPWC
jgi:hypothetical protein